MFLLNILGRKSNEYILEKKKFLENVIKICNKNF